MDFGFDFQRVGMTSPATSPQPVRLRRRWFLCPRQRPGSSARWFCNSRGRSFKANACELADCQTRCRTAWIVAVDPAKTPDAIIFEFRPKTLAGCCHPSRGVDWHCGTGVLRATSGGRYLAPNQSSRPGNESGLSLAIATQAVGGAADRIGLAPARKPAAVFQHQWRRASHQRIGTGGKPFGRPNCHKRSWDAGMDSATIKT